MKKNGTAIYAAADSATAASDDASSKFVGRAISSADWVNIWNIEADAKAANARAAKIGPAGIRKYYSQFAAMHSAFAEAALIQAAA